MSRRNISNTKLISILAALVVTGIGLDALAQQQQWRFKYFAGDPPQWQDQPGFWGNKAECEIARAEKTKAGYPVGDCYALPAMNTSLPAPKPSKPTPPPKPPKPVKADKTTGSTHTTRTTTTVKQNGQTKTVITTTTTQPRPAATPAPNGGGVRISKEAQRMEQMRLERVKMGCLGACKEELKVCTAMVPSTTNCMQAKNAECIESCVAANNPHNECINEVCLPTDLNQAEWQAECEARSRKAADTCSQTLVQCEQKC